MANPVSARIVAGDRTPTHPSRCDISPRNRHFRPYVAAALASLAAATLALSACQAGSAAKANDSTGDDTPSTTEQRTTLTDTLDAYVRQHPGLIASVSLRHGDTTLDYGADTRYETASVVKVEILVRWLATRQDETLPPKELALAERMITESDNEATSELCELLAAESEPVDIPGGTGVCVDAPGWGTDETTAADQTRILTTAFEAELLTPESHRVVEDLMSDVEPAQAWGVTAAANDGETTWLKNGWDVRDNGWLAHSEGVIDSHDGEPVYLTVLTNGNDTEAEGIAHVEDLADIARDSLTP
ncbi:serine hydrolase [Stackebrandtia nassauensis]|uniref:Beta-lactamase class A catalytic domain-containing protein n=1 Tax=Stackebrandtia nassauensis (strain DSM 44728 / CIP 108903 / NRRL B-16338 / NBRC 102104 / LLR-40K-21) TaxID=446470 RepID=D3Q1E9_STANL|nr:serine hydrolase [Stackebrandtia nassauensis]ADD45729.1 hypothetical protein Snas_6105 [Stackebrandtia nassauensis DSM 44728]